MRNYWCSENENPSPWQPSFFKIEGSRQKLQKRLDFISQGIIGGTSRMEQAIEEMRNKFL